MAGPVRPSEIPSQELLGILFGVSRLMPMYEGKAEVIGAAAFLAAPTTPARTVPVQWTNSVSSG